MKKEVWIDFEYSKPPINEKVKVKLSETYKFFAVYKGNNILECVEGTNPVNLNLTKDFDLDAKKNMKWCEI